MITYVSGSLFTSPAQVLVNTVNTQGVMGKGIALQFKKTYPQMFKTYQDFCEQGKIDIGVLWIYKTPHKWILNFPTKKHWRNPSQPQYIEAGLKKLTKSFSELGIYSIAFPALGCGNGELDWEKTVKPLMETYLNKLPADVFVHPPLSKGNLPEHKDQKDVEKWLRSEPMSLSFNEVWADLSRLLEKKSEFSTPGESSVFRVQMVENQMFIADGDNRLLLIEANHQNYKIEYEELLEVWQQLRRHGYLRRDIISQAMAVRWTYLMSILSELDYVEKVELSETGFFAGSDAVNQSSFGLQYVAPSSVKQPKLFHL